MGSKVTRPVQFNITNHINKCRDEAIQQQQWIDEGKLYYARTINSFKERAEQLRQIAEMYEKMYIHFTSDQLSEVEISVVIEDAEHLSDVTQVADDTSKGKLSSLCSIELIDKYNEGIKADFRDKFNVEIAKCLKGKLGAGVDNLSKQTIGAEGSVPNLFSKMTTNWFNERCNWPAIDRTNRIHYNLGSFNKSLDALIFAFSASAYPDNVLNIDNVYDFMKDMKDWLYNEGENHVRGEPEPYASERNGLVSRSIVKYMDNGLKNIDPLAELSSHSKVFYLATYLENIIKPVVYADSLELLTGHDPLALSYFHSVRNRIESKYDSTITSFSTQQLQSMIDGDTV